MSTMRWRRDAQRENVPFRLSKNDTAALMREGAPLLAVATAEGDNRDIRCAFAD
jgi:hypothetical protein